MSGEKKLYTTPEAADHIGMSSSRLRGLIAEGEARPVQQIGGTWLFDEAEIERLRNRPDKRRRKQKT